MPIKTFYYTHHLDQLVPLLLELEQKPALTTRAYQQLVKRYVRADGHIFSKDQIIAAYRALAGTNGLKPFDEGVVQRLMMKPIRTQSGVTPITVLTKPFPCPGKCIFCPNDIRMPKSYLSDEPGAQRAERNFFDPYLQTYNRLQALYEIGHNVDKAEIIVLGGTWSYYPEAYQIWFIKECFRALNEFGSADDRQRISALYRQMEEKYQQLNMHAPSDDPEENKSSTFIHQIKGDHLEKTYNQVISSLYVAPERLAGFSHYQSATWAELEQQQQKNELAQQRCVGLVIETRPDNISPQEVIRIRRLGCTKTQIGVQSLQDDVLTKNNRGHDVAATRRAFGLLRQAGFKIHAHWMANLYGSSVGRDITDFDQLFADPDFCPDELKIYPCSLIESAELMTYYQARLWKPYTHDELLEVVAHSLAATPPYCRLTRVIRDIPSTDIVDGNKLTNFRQVATSYLTKHQTPQRDIRAREIRNHHYDSATQRLDEVTYETSVSTEVFLQVLATSTIDGEEKILGFLRLSLPTQEPFIDELKAAALIREVHVYGPATKIGTRKLEQAQHVGLGTQLLERAKEIAKVAGYQHLAVISAIGTREYYRSRGFYDGQLYQLLPLVPHTKNA